MKMFRCTAVLVVVLLAVGTASAADHRSGVGFAVMSGTVDSDILLNPIDFIGFEVFYKQGFTDAWGLLISFRDMQDDENLFLGEEDDYTQIGVHAVYMWRAGKAVRPHVKFGVVSTDFEAQVPGFPSESDSDVTISIGGGLEAGSEAVAFFADFDYTQPEITLLNVPEDLWMWNLALGMIFKF